MAVLSWRELKALNDQKQVGGLEEVPEGVEWLQDWDREAPDAQEQYYQRVRNQVLSDRRTPQEQRARLEEIQNDDSLLPQYTEQDVIDSGYGEFRKDLNVPFSKWSNNPIDYRSNQQTGIGQLANGFAKMIVNSGATFLDNTAGLVWGLVNGAVDAVDGDGFTPLSSFINNGVSNGMQQLRDWSERVFPNYRTTEELADQDRWLRHLNANFWGDTFMKNLGFTIGAGAAGLGYSRLASALHEVNLGKVANKAYKAALAASGGDAEAEAAFREVLRGAPVNDVKRLYNTFDKVRKSYARMDIGRQIIGGAGGAVGEARMESIMSAREFRDEYLGDAQAKYEQGKMELAESISTNPLYVDEETGQINQAGMEAWNAGLQQLQGDYDKEKATVEAEADKVAHNTFWPNMFLLTGSNMVMFGRLMAGGYKPQVEARVRGRIGNYRQRGNTATAIGLGLRNSLTEGGEELMQKVFSEGAKDLSERNMADFYNGRYDKDGIRDVSETIASLLNTAGEVLGESTSWQEFAVGAITGAIGIPTRHGMSGGIYGGIKEGLAANKKSKELAEELNKAYQNPDFKELFEGMVRHRKYEISKEDDLAHGNEFGWHNDNHSQLIGDVIMFAKTGRLRDLEDYVDSFANVKLEDIPEIREQLVDETDPEFQNKTDEQILGWMHDNAKEAKKTINQYRAFYDSLDYLSFGTTDEKVIEELVYSQSRMQNFEDRYNAVVKEVTDAIRPTLERVAQQKKKDGSPTKRAVNARLLLDSYNNLTELFGGAAYDLAGRGTEADARMASKMAVMIDDLQQRDILDRLKQLGAFTDKPDLKQKVIDLQKMVRSRQEFYSRLFNPTMRKAFEEKVEQDAVNPEERSKEIHKEEAVTKAQQYVEQLNRVKSLKDYISLANSVGAIDDDDTVNVIADAIEKNPKLRNYRDTLAAGETFFNGLAELEQKHRAEKGTPKTVPVYDRLEQSLAALDTDAILADAPEGESPAVAISRAVLDSVAADKQAYKLAESLLAEKLGDAAKVKELGKLKEGEQPKEKKEQSTKEQPTETAPTGEAPAAAPAGETADETPVANPPAAQTETPAEAASAPQVATGTTQEVAPESVPENTNNTAEVLFKEIDKALTLDDPVLQKVLAGDFTGYEGLTDKEKLILVSYARQIQQQLETAKGDIATGSREKPEQPQRHTNQRRKNARMNESVEGTLFTVYNTTWLNTFGMVQDFVSNRPGTNASVRWLKQHNVHRFVDSGALAELDETYRERHNGERLPIYFIANPVLKPNNLDANPFVVANTDNADKSRNVPVAPNVLLAIEMTDENKEILKQYEDAGIFSKDDAVTIGEGENAAQYQVVGVLWNKPDSYIEAQIDEDTRQSLTLMKERSRKIWDHAIANSIWPQYKADLDSANGNVAKFPDEGKWYVAKVHNAQGQDRRLSTSLNYIMSGRNETRPLDTTATEENMPEIPVVPLVQSLSEYRRLGKPYYFGIMTGDGIKTSPAAPPFAAGVNAPLGSLWLATKEANGAWSWTYVTIPTTQEYGLRKNADSPVVTRLRSILGNIFEKSKIEDGASIWDMNDASVVALSGYQQHKEEFNRKLQAVKELYDMFYTGKENGFSPMFDEQGNPQLIIGDMVSSSVEEALENLEDAQFGFQVNLSDVTSSSKMNSLIDSGILRADMQSFMRKNASIAINYLEDEDAEGRKVEPYVVESNYPVGWTDNAEVGDVQYTPEGNISNIRIGDAGYRIDETGAVYRAGRSYEGSAPISDATLVAQVKAIAELMQLDAAGEGFSEYPGNRWTVRHEKERQYINLFERVVDGTRVHMMQMGSDGGFSVVFSDSYWNALMQVAEPVGKNPFRKRVREAAQQELEAEREQELAEEQKAEEAPRGRVTRSSKRNRGKKETASTVQEKAQDEARKAEEEDCG